jgi:glucose/mannose transport system substrate-binding protein
MFQHCKTAFVSVVMMSIFLTACAPQVIVETVVVTQVMTEIVEIPGIPITKEVIETYVVEITPIATKKLEIFHWWTSPSQRETVEAMFRAFKTRYADVEIIENPMPTGSSADPQTVLQSRITAGLPPDTFQVLGGAEIKGYVDKGVLQPLDELYAVLDYAEVIPEPLLKSVSVDGRPYAVPLNIHIQNLLYYNKKLFEELEITPPTTFNELLSACKAISANKLDMSCMALGSKDKWSDALIFESLLLDKGGPEYYAQLFKGEVDVATDENFKKALENYQRLLPYINKDHASLTWEQAVALVGSGVSAMTLTGSWAIGAFIEKSNWQPGVDFGAISFPQKSERVLLFHSDAFGIAAGAPDPEEGLAWLEAVGSPDVQIPASAIQSGLFARTDIDPAEHPDPIRQELQAFARDNPSMLILDQQGGILPSIAQPVYWDIISDFLIKPSPNETMQDIDNMMTTYNVNEASAWYQWP